MRAYWKVSNFCTRVATNFLVWLLGSCLKWPPTKKGAVATLDQWSYTGFGVRSLVVHALTDELAVATGRKICACCGWTYEPDSPHAWCQKKLNTKTCEKCRTRRPLEGCCPTCREIDLAWAEHDAAEEAAHVEEQQRQDELDEDLPGPDEPREVNWGNAGDPMSNRGYE